MERCPDKSGTLIFMINADQSAKISGIRGKILPQIAQKSEIIKIE
jgi:hypothetical protein